MLFIEEKKKVKTKLKKEALVKNNNQNKILNRQQNWKKNNIKIKTIFYTYILH